MIQPEYREPANDSDIEVQEDSRAYYITWNCPWVLSYLDARVTVLPHQACIFIPHKSGRGTDTRSFMLAVMIDTEVAKAEFVNGVLDVVLPKKVLS